MPRRTLSRIFASTRFHGARPAFYAVSQTDLRAFFQYPAIAAWTKRLSQSTRREIMLKYDTWVSSDSLASQRPPKKSRSMKNGAGRGFWRPFLGPFLSQLELPYQSGVLMKSLSALSLAVFEGSFAIPSLPSEMLFVSQLLLVDVVVVLLLPRFLQSTLK